MVAIPSLILFSLIDKQNLLLQNVESQNATVSRLMEENFKSRTQLREDTANGLNRLADIILKRINNLEDKLNSASAFIKETYEVTRKNIGVFNENLMNTNDDTERIGKEMVSEPLYSSAPNMLLSIF